MKKKLRRAKNFRDLGGIRTTDGRVLKKCMLLRGGTLYRLKKNDIRILKEEYCLKSVIDLRTRKESQEKPDSIIDGVTYFQMPVLTEALVGVSHERKVHSLYSLRVMPRMEELYASMVTAESLENLVNTLRTILLLPDEQFAVVFHCSAGKDRTGILAALLLSFLGVDRETIIQDYIKISPAEHFKAVFAYIGLLLIQLNHRLAHKVHQYFLPAQPYIESALDTIENNYGSLQNFFDQKLGLTPEQKAAIRDKFLE